MAEFGHGIDHFQEINVYVLIIFQGDKRKWLEDLFVFFSVSQFNHVFKEHRLYLVTMSKTSPVQFLRRFFTEQGAYDELYFMC